MNPNPRPVLTADGDVRDVNCWSNIPYHFFMAGKKAGFFDDGLAINLRKLKWPRLIWNGLAPFRGERYGGFRFTRIRNEYMARQIDWGDVDEVLSLSPTFPSFDLMQKKDIVYSHYLDFPLRNFFVDYGMAEKIGARIARNALARERDQLAAAKFVVCMSPWAARQVIEHYDTPAHKVHTIIPGANLPEEQFGRSQEPEPLEPPDGKRIPLRIAFVGIAAIRKGLGRLVEAVRILRSRGFRVSVRVMGPAVNPFPDDSEIEHLGFIDKQREPLRVMRELRTCHMGALPSYQEAFGIAALEFLRCGLPALITRAGGLGDSIPPDCGIIMEQNCDGGDIADALENLLRNPDSFALLRQNAQANADYASWDRCVRDFQQLWSGQDTPSSFAN